VSFCFLINRAALHVNIEGRNDVKEATGLDDGRLRMDAIKVRFNLPQKKRTIYLWLFYCNLRTEDFLFSLFEYFKHTNSLGKRLFYKDTGMFV